MKVKYLQIIVSISSLYDDINRICEYIDNSDSAEDYHEKAANSY